MCPGRTVAHKFSPIQLSEGFGSLPVLSILACRSFFFRRMGNFLYACRRLLGGSMGNNGLSKRQAKLSPTGFTERVIALWSLPLKKDNLELNWVMGQESSCVSLEGTQIKVF
jgi:hypothetical protein